MLKQASLPSAAKHVHNQGTKLPKNHFIMRNILLFLLIGAISVGANLVYGPKVRSMALGVASWSSNDQEYFERRCLNEFGWGTDEVDVDAGSGESA